MLSVASGLFLILYVTSLVFTYLSIRMGWLRVPAAIMLGAVSSVLFLVLYSLLKGNGFNQAITVGLGLGLLSTLGAVSISLFFTASKRAEARQAVDDKPHDQ